MKIISIIALIILTASYFLAESKKDIVDDVFISDSLRVVEPKNHFTLENQLVTTMLARYHYKDFSLDDSL